MGVAFPSSCRVNVKGILGAVLVQLEWTAWKLSKKWSAEPPYMAITQTYVPYIGGGHSRQPPRVAYTEKLLLQVRLAQSVRALRLHRRSRGFESLSAHFLYKCSFRCSLQKALDGMC